MLHDSISMTFWKRSVIARGWGKGEDSMNVLEVTELF